MRIRKRSISALSSFPSNKESGCTGEEAAAAAAVAKEKEFLLPLIAAVMDVQAKAEFSGGEGTILPTAGNGIAETDMRPVHKWRNTLVRCNAESEVLQVSGEADKFIYGCNEIVRNREDKSEPLESEAISIFEKETSCQLDRLQEAQDESGRSEMWRDRKVDLDAVTVKKQQRRKAYITHVNEEREDAIKIIGRKETETVPNNIQKNKHKLTQGSQCRRRNGRGWRCSERTLVGYFLCEHHLGKSRFKSIYNCNTAAINDDPALLKYNKAATKFKELHLIHAAAPPL